eukprot:614581-Alexandrium_andersonii.AAC.1
MHGARCAWCLSRQRSRTQREFPAQLTQGCSWCMHGVTSGEPTPIGVLAQGKHSPFVDVYSPLSGE